MTATLAHTDTLPGELAATEPPTVAASVEPVTLESLAQLVNASRAEVADMRAELARLVGIAEALGASAGQVTAQLSKGGISGIMGLLLSPKG